MKKSSRFKPIQQLTEAREQDAAKALGKSNQKLGEQEQRLQDLLEYHQEYQHYFQQRGQSGITAAKLQELQRFLHNLNQAIEQQRRIVELARHELKQYRQQWQQAHGRTMAIGKVVERYRSDEAIQADRREQKENDDLAQRGAGLKPKT